MTAVRVHLLIRGRVQGVFFRGFTEIQARALGLTGWVRNRPDGGVEVLAEGPRPRLDELIEVLRQGPPGARVAGLEAEWAEAVGDLADFRIAPSG